MSGTAPATCKKSVRLRAVRGRVGDWAAPERAGDLCDVWRRKRRPVAYVGIEWEHPSLADRVALAAAELVAFDVLEPPMRSRGGITAAAMKRADDLWRGPCRIRCDSMLHS
jgi:hypothetical protein